jgi:hypothetical protein
MGSWLESYDILYWEKDKKVYVSRNYPEIVHALTIEGYVLRCDGSELNGSISRLLDEEMGAVPMENVLPEPKTKERAKEARSTK